jgi:hypothetical protein
MPGKRKSSFQNVLSDNFVHLHCHQPSAIKHNKNRKKQRKEKARAENEEKDSLLRLEQDRIENLVSTSINMKKGPTERISALDELQQLDIPPFVKAKSLIEGAGAGIIVNWDAGAPILNGQFRIPFRGLQYVDYYPWEAHSWVLGNITSNDTNINSYKKRLRTHKPKKIWVPRNISTRAQYDELNSVSANTINYCMSKDTPDEEAIVPETGQDRRIANCKFIVPSNPYTQPSAERLSDEELKKHFGPGFELYIDYGQRFGAEKEYVELLNDRWQTLSINWQNNVLSKRKRKPFPQNNNNEDTSKTVVQYDGYRLHKAAIDMELATLRDMRSELNGKSLK